MMNLIWTMKKRGDAEGQDKDDQQLTNGRQIILKTWVQLEKPTGCITLLGQKVHIQQEETRLLRLCKTWHWVYYTATKRGAASGACQEGYSGTTGITRADSERAYNLPRVRHVVVIHILQVRLS